MRVDPSRISNAAAEAAKTTKSERMAAAKDRKPASASEVFGAPGVKAEISSRARDAALAKSVAESAPDVREDRVAELRKKIADGSYRIDSDAIAERLVNEHLASASAGA